MLSVERRPRWVLGVLRHPLGVLVLLAAALATAVDEGTHARWFALALQMLLVVGVAAWLRTLLARRRRGGRNDG